MRAGPYQGWRKTYPLGQSQNACKLVVELAPLLRENPIIPAYGAFEAGWVNV